MKSQILNLKLTHACDFTCCTPKGTPKVGLCNMGRRTYQPQLVLRFNYASKTKIKNWHMININTERIQHERSGLALPLAAASSRSGRVLVTGGLWLFGSFALLWASTFVLFGLSGLGLGTTALGFGFWGFCLCAFWAFGLVAPASHSLLQVQVFVQSPAWKLRGIYHHIFG